MYSRESSPSRRERDGGLLSTARHGCDTLAAPLPASRPPADEASGEREVEVDDRHASTPEMAHEMEEYADPGKRYRLFLEGFF